MPGRERSLAVSWKDTRVVNCTYCGRMIARRYWEDRDFPGDRFCEERCADVKRSLLATPREASVS